MKKIVSVIAGTALSCLTAVANAGALNPSFEAGLSNWSTLGQVTTVPGLGAISPTDGSSAAFLSTSNGSTGASEGTIETTLGLAAGALDGISTNGATEGSVIYQTFAGTAGSTISFDFLFITDEQVNPPTDPWNDFAFVSIMIDGVLSSIASVNSSAFVNNPSSVAHGEGGAAVWGDTGGDYDQAGLTDTGWLSFSHVLASSGLVTLGIGIMDGADSGVESGLMIDNVQPVPEPAALTLLLLGLMGLGLRQRIAA